MVDKRRLRRTILSEQTLEWLEKKSDQNLLLMYLNNLNKLPKIKKQDLENKGYIAGSMHAGEIINLFLTKEGNALLNEIIETIY